jgi:hypothetical protein
MVQNTEENNCVPGYLLLLSPLAPDVCLRAIAFSMCRSSTSPVPIDAGHRIASGITETNYTDCGNVYNRYWQLQARSRIAVDLIHRPSDALRRMELDLQVVCFPLRLPATVQSRLALVFARAPSKPWQSRNRSLEPDLEH